MWSMSVQRRIPACLPPRQKTVPKTARASYPIRSKTQRAIGVSVTGQRIITAMDLARVRDT